MAWLGTATKELWSLFIDDGQLAVLTLAWLGVVALLAHFGGADGVALPVIWPLGLALIVIEGVVRAARKSAKQRGGTE